MAYDKEQNDKIWSEFINGKGEDEKFIQKQMDIAAQIDNYLKENGWTREELAARAELHQSQVTEILAAQANPTLRTITKIEEALGKDVIVSPDFYEEDLEERGWQRPGTDISVSAGEYKTVITGIDTEFLLIDNWEGEVKVKRQQYESANVYPLRPTGTYT